MSFITNNLSANETVIYKTELHWWVFVKGSLILLLGILLMSYSGTAGSILLTIGLVYLGIQYLNWSSAEFVITNKRVILKTGIISRRLVELQLNKAEGLAVEQGLVGRMLNFGGVAVTSGGVKNAFAPMAMPFAFKKQVNEAIEEYAK